MTYYPTINKNIVYHITVGLGSSVGTEIGYGLDGPGIESRWGEIFCTCPDQTWGPPSLLCNGYSVFPGGKEWLGRDADPSPPSSAMVLSYTTTPPMGHTACTEPHCLYKGALYFLLFTSYHILATCFSIRCHFQSNILLQTAADTMRDAFLNVIN
jgi:hypothetical protein